MAYRSRIKWERSRPDRPRVRATVVLERMGAKKLSLKKFASECKITEDYMKGVLAGLRPGRLLARRMAVVLGCSLRQLLEPMRRNAA